MYQVFFLREGEWHKHGAPYVNLRDAKAERDYLAFALGLFAQVFEPL